MKACFVVLCAVICMFAHAEIGRAELIDFDDLDLSPSEALLITNQYQHLGVLFSGEGTGSGLVYREGYYGTANFGNSSPNIMDMGWRDEATIATFVIPGTTTPTVATNVSVLTGDGNPDQETFTVESFDINGNTLFSQTYTTTVSGQLIQFSGEVASIRFVVEPGAESGACLDDLSFTVIPAPVPAIETTIDIDPDTLNLQSKGEWITCYIWLPEEYDVADVDPNSLMLEDQIPADWMWFEEEWGLVMAKFNRSEVQDILNVGEVELTVTGELTDGTKFEGTDTIRVIDKGGKK